MAFNSRDLWIVLKARDEATRALNSYSRAVRDAGNATRIAQLEAQRAMAQSTIAQRNNAEALLRNNIAQEENRRSIIQSQIAHLANERALNQNAIAQGRFTGATNNQINTLRQHGLALQGQIIGYRQAGQGIRDNINAMRGNLLTHQQATLGVRGHIAAIDSQINALRQADAALDGHRQNLGRVHAAMQSVAQSAFAVGFGLATIGIAGAAGLFQTVKAWQEYDRQARLTATQTVGFGQNLQEVGDIGKRVANSIGVGFKEIQPALYDIFSSMDVSVKDSEILLTGFAKAAVAGQTDIQSVSRGTIGIINSFNLKAQDTNRILDLQFEFIRKGVGTYDEWAKRIGLVSPSAVRAGQSLETMMAALASASRMSGVAARAGTAVARAFDAISNSNAAESLKKLGISVQDAQGNFRPFIDIMFDIRKHLDKIPGEAAKAAVIQEIFKGAGGTIEARRFINNLLLVSGNLEDLQSIYEDTKNSGGALDKAYGVMADSMAAKTEKLKNKFELFKIAVGKALEPAFGRIIESLSDLLDWFNKLDPKMQGQIANWALLGVAVSTAAGAFAFIIGAIALIVGAFAIAGTAILATIGVIAGLIAVFGGLGFAFYELYQNSEQFRALVKSIGDFLRQLGKIAGDTWKDIADLYKTHLKPALNDLWFTFDTKVMPVVRELWDYIKSKLIPAFKEFADWVKDRVRTAFDIIKSAIEDVLIPALEKAVKFYQDHKDKIDEVIEKVIWLAKWIEKLGAALAILGGGALLGLLIASFGSLIALFVGLGDAAMWLDTQFGKLTDRFSSDLVDAMYAVQDLVNQATGGFNVLRENISNNMDVIRNIITTHWENIKAYLNNTWENIKSTASAAWNRLVDIISGAWTTIVNTINVYINNAVSSVNNGWNNIRNFAGIVWNQVVGIVVGAWNTIVGFIRGAVANVIGEAGKLGNIPGMIRGFFNQLPGAAAGGIEGLIGLVRSLPGRILGALGNLGGLLFGAGQDIVFGLANGIRSAVGSAVSAAANAAAAALAAAKAAVGVSSPSKEFAKLGGYVIEGFVVGIKANEAMLSNAVSRAFTNITDPNLVLGTNGPDALRAIGGIPTTNQIPFNQSSISRPINIVVNTQEIDPRRHAEELGRELAGMP